MLFREGRHQKVLLGMKKGVIHTFLATNFVAKNVWNFGSADKLKDSIN